MPETARLDAAFSILEDRLCNAAQLDLSTGEPVISDEAPGVGGPLRVLTIYVREKPWALLGLTETTVAVEKAGLIEYLARRARVRHISYIVVSNLRDALLLPIPDRPGVVPDPIKRYPPLYQIAPGADDALTPLARIAFVDCADEIAANLATLHREGALGLVIPDADFFVERLTYAVGILKPTVKHALRAEIDVDPEFREELSQWAVRQGIPADLRSDDFIESVVRQAIYRLLGKIIFYQSLRRAAPQLPPMDLADLDTGQVVPSLERCFAAAHQIDYHAVFREDVVDRLPFPAAASAELRDLVGDLNTRDFAHLPQDVVGAVFERLIPPEDRHALGQFFTREPLVDLIVTFCVRNSGDTVLDPTCGTGTFLIRAYDRLQTRLGVHDHGQLLSQLWGVDVAPFPAELATINLFRQRVGDASNFPRVLNEDFFDVVPGGTYRFPPLRSEEEDEWVDEPIPEFNAIVGNFPYINASLIDRTIKGYREIVARRLAEDWFGEYPDGFTFSHKADAREQKLARQHSMALDVFVEKAEPIISTFADLYVSLFWHAGAFLMEGGRMGIVTSNAWLDVGYGYGLQRFLLDHFKIIAVLESRCEPWFLEAAVNTVVTIVERCSDVEDRDAHPARFVKVKKPLDELIPWDLRLDALNRWIGLDKIVQRIEGVWQVRGESDHPNEVEDEKFRVRAVRQSVLRTEIETVEQTVKWGPYLRAPGIYFDLLREVSDKLALLRDVAPPSRGSLTGKNEFYHLDDDTINEWHIESEFLFPLLKSPGDSDHILIDKDELDLKVFICRLTKDELKAQGKANALRYIEWGEQQTTSRGVAWPKGAEVRNRKPGWYALPEYRSRPAQLFFASAYGERHVHKYSNRPLIADKRLYFLTPVGDIPLNLVAAIMNSSLTAFFTELAGRVTLGDGVLELTVEDARDYLLVPDARQLGGADRDRIIAAFEPLLARPIGSVFDELRQPDRRALDETVLRAVGLDPDQWLPRLYDGLRTLVRERVHLAQMRSKARRGRPERAANRVADDVLHDLGLLPDGPARFPDEFLSQAARVEGVREIPLPDGQLRYVGPHFGQEQLATEDGEILMLTSKFEMRYVLFAQAAGQEVARLPKQPVEIARTVNNYVQYLRDLRERLHATYFKRTLNQASAERFVTETWRTFGLPELE